MGRRRWQGLCVLVVLLAAAGCSDGPGDASAEPASATTRASSSPAGLSLVAIGDSIPYNSADDCPGCTGFIDRYADAVAAATGTPVQTTNLSEHTGQTLQGLVAELDRFEDQLRSADVIVIGIAHNSIALNANHCGATVDATTNGLSDWSVVDQDCAERSAAASRPLFDELLSKVVEWRSAKPTIFRALDKYNDWIGWPEANFTPPQEKRTTLQHDVWNKMICDVAEAHDVTCVDIYHAFNGPDGHRASGDLLAGDYTHPSDKGNALIAKVLVAEGFAPLA